MLCFWLKAKQKTKTAVKGKGKKKAADFRMDLGNCLHDCSVSGSKRRPCCHQGTGQLIFQTGVNEGCHKMGQVTANEPGKGCYKTF